MQPHLLFAEGQLPEQLLQLPHKAEKVQVAAAPTASRNLNPQRFQKKRGR